jgi:hypothetical protein
MHIRLHLVPNFFTNSVFLAVSLITFYIGIHRHAMLGGERGLLVSPRMRIVYYIDYCLFERDCAGQSLIHAGKQGWKCLDETTPRDSQAKL